MFVREYKYTDFHLNCGLFYFFKTELWIYFCFKIKYWTRNNSNALHYNNNWFTFKLISYQQKHTARLPAKWKQWGKGWKRNRIFHNEGEEEEIFRQFSLLLLRKRKYWLFNLDKVDGQAERVQMSYLGMCFHFYSFPEWSSTFQL